MVKVFGGLKRVNAGMAFIDSEGTHGCKLVTDTRILLWVVLRLTVVDLQIILFDFLGANDHREIFFEDDILKLNKRMNMISMLLC